MAGTRLHRRRAAVTAAVLLSVGGWPAVGTGSAPDPAGAHVATVHTGGSRLNVRGGPSMDYPVLGHVADRDPVRIGCQLYGDPVRGDGGATPIWLRRTAGGYLAAAFLSWPASSPPVPWCATARTPPGGGVTVRANASTALAGLGLLGAGEVAVTCQLAGESVAGRVRRTALWDRLPSGRYLPDADLVWRPSRPPLIWCGLPAMPPPRVGAFVDWAGRYSVAAGAAYLTPPSVVLAQAMVASGWGTSALARSGNGYFAMPCLAGPGPFATGCRPYPARDCAVTGCRVAAAFFRVYAAPGQSFLDSTAWFAGTPRCRPALARAGGADRVLAGLSAAGCLDAGYAHRLAALIRAHRLDRFDRA
jgi:Mannosyl-glycoprotein endo-beta-N-acetylglucosaminidase